MLAIPADSITIDLGGDNRARGNCGRWIV